MAIQWGDYSGSTYWKIRLGVDVSWSRVTSSSKTAVVTFKTYTQAVGAYADNQHLTFGGGMNSGPDIDFEHKSSNGSNPAVLRSTRTWTYTYPSTLYGSSPGGGSFSVRLSGAVNGASPGVTVRTEIPARPIGEPLSPSSMSATRVNDSTADLAWTNKSSAGAPYDTIGVHQRDWQGQSWGGWRRIATLSGSAKAYRVTGLSSNALYDWQVDAHNATGRSSVAGASAVNTTPAPPTGVRTKVSTTGGSTTTSWTSDVYGAPNSDGAALDHSFIIERATITADGSTTWARVATGVQSPWTDPAPHAGQNQYRVASKSDVYAPLVSTWSTGNTVSTIVPPVAPSNLSPNGAPVDLWFEGATLEWRHNDGGDGVDQTRAEFSFSFDDGTTWLPDPPFWIEGSGQQTEFFPEIVPNNRDILWRVRTRGVESEGFGPWSAPAMIQARTRPDVGVAAPGAVTTTGNLSTSWTYSQQPTPARDPWGQGGQESSPQSEWRVTLLDENNTVLEELSGFTDQTSAAFETRLKNGSAYTVQVRARSAAGLWSEVASVQTTVDFPDPAAVLATPTFRPADGTVSLRVQPLAPQPDEAPVVAVTIERRVDDGPWVELATNIPLPTELIDPLPTLAGANHYRLTSVSDIPTYRTNPIVTLHTPSGAVNAGEAPPIHDYGFVPWVRVNTGAAWADSVAVYGNLDVSSATSRKNATHRFLGRGKPIGTFGVNTTREISVSGRLTWRGQDDRRDSSSAKQWEDLGLTAGLVAFRDPMGHRIFGVIGDVSVKHTSPGAADVSLTVTEVDHKEAYGAPVFGDENVVDDFHIELLPEGGFHAWGESVNDNGNGTWSASSQKITDYGQPSGVWHAAETE